MFNGVAVSQSPPSEVSHCTYELVTKILLIEYVVTSVCLSVCPDVQNL